MEPADVLKRIDEILEDNKAMGVEPSSKRKLAECLGHQHHMNITRWLKEENVALHYREIAKGLGISLNRLLQTDNEEVLKELEDLLEKRSDPEKALSLAKKLAYMAKGASEKYISFKNLGLAYSQMNVHDEAMIAYEKSRGFIDKANIESDEQADILLRIAMEHYYINDIAKFGDLLGEAEALSDNELIRGRILQFVGMVCYNHCKKIPMAEKHNMMALDFLDQAGDKVRIAKTYHNLAEFAFQEKRYDDCIRYHTAARIYLPKFDLQSQIRSDLDYAKFLYCAKRVQESKEIIKTHIEQDQIFDPLMRAKYLMLLTEIEKDARILEPVFDLIDLLPNWIKPYIADLYMSYVKADKFTNFAYNTIRVSSPIAQKKFYEEELF